MKSRVAQPLWIAVALGAVWPVAAVSQDQAAQPVRPATSAPEPAKDAAPASKDKAAPANDNTRIQVTGRRDAVEQRRISSAAKIVVGREEIEQYGDATLGDLLKRLPSVTVGGRPGRGGGQIRMRGMGGGYTQILVDGERMPPGFAIDQIAPDQIERIEILRAPTAETGARAVAGTINIVLREPLRQRGDDLRLGVSGERSNFRPQVSWTRNGMLGPDAGGPGGGTYNLNLSASHADTRTDTRTDTTAVDLASGQPVLAQTRTGQQHERRSSVNLTGRVQWPLGERAGGGNVLGLQPFVVLNQSDSDSTGQLVQSLGRVPAPYALSNGRGESRSVLARLAMNLRQRLGDDTRLELRGNVGRFNSRSGSDLHQQDANAAPVLDQRADTRITDRTWALNGKLSHSLFDKHSLVAGLEGEGVQRSENTITRVNGAPTLVDFDGDLTASTQRLAAYVQDEWDPAPAWSAYAGLRWESIRTRSESIGAPVSNTGRVLTPLAHAVWRFNAPARDQLRFSLTRSYRPPTLGNLTAVPRISMLYPAPGGNLASSPDRAGNADLRPELARGLDVALERYLPGGGVLSVSVFSRQIQDVIRNVTALESVAWAAVPRWVSRPQNIGNASTQGVELDAKFRLDEVLADTLPALNLRGNLGLYRSAVSGVPGPNNRIDGQPRISANFGADYRLRSLPLSLGANLNLVPAYTVQQTDAQSQTLDAARVLDGYLLWSMDAATRLRFSLSNIVPRQYITRSTVLADGQAQTTASNGPTYRAFALRLEMKL